MKKKILLVGSKGFFGKNINKYFKKKFYIKNITRKANINKIKLKNFSYIINCAAEVYNDKKMFKNNTALIDSILKKIIYENKKIKIIHFGSSAEYGNLKFPAKENSLLKPRTVYESTKAASCLLVEGYSRQYDLKSVIIRPFAVYGPHENLTRLIPNIFRHFMFNENLTIYNGFHDFVYINDMIKFIKFIINKNESFYDGKIINFGSGKQYSNFQILKICENIFKKKSKCLLIKKFQRSYDSLIWKNNNFYLKKKIKFRLKYNIYDGIKSYYNTIKKEKINIKINSLNLKKRIKIKENFILR